MKKLKKILLIDDDKVNNYLNETILESLAIAERVSIETNGAEAMKHLVVHCEGKEKNPVCPELVIFDHHIPVMDGLEMMKELHHTGLIEAQQIVFILLAIVSTPQEIEAFKALGVQEFTTKPLSTEVVMDTYHKYFFGDSASTDEN